MLASPVFALIALAWGFGFLLFSEQKKYGIAILVASIAGGGISLSIIFALSFVFDFGSALNTKGILIFFASGFGIAGCTVGAICFFAVLFSVNNRWAARRRNLQA